VQLQDAPLCSSSFALMVGARGGARGKISHAKIKLTSGALICAELQVPFPLSPCGRGDRQEEEGGLQICCSGARLGVSVQTLIHALEAMM
jgi:hypothetical protein